jgi:hypothetical protein
MRSLSSIIFLFSLLLLVGACSRVETTPATLEISFAKFESDLGANGAGGVYLYGYGPAGKSFGQVMNGTSFRESLPNGTWSFYAVAWEEGFSGLGNLSGVTRCATTTALLTGSEVNLSLSLTQAGCNNPVFTNNVAMRGVDIDYDSVIDFYGFPELQVAVCNKLPTSFAANSSSNTQTKCEYNLRDPQSKLNRGHFSSIKVSLPTFSNLNGTLVESGTESELESNCIEMSGPSNISADTLNLPMGSSSAPFPIRMRGYYRNLACNDIDVAGSKAIFLAKGRLEDSSAVKSYIGLDSDINQVVGKLYLETPDSEVCQGLRLLLVGMPGVPEFSSGTGSSLNPFSICNVGQFNSIAAEPSYASSSFRLMQDLDFSLTPIVPIGSSLIDSPSSSMEFTGTFDGGGKTLSHFSISASVEQSAYDDNGGPLSLYYIGLFRYVTTGAIKNLKIVDSGLDVYCDAERCNGIDSVGLLVGRLSTSDIMNVQITGDIRVKSESDLPTFLNHVGGFIGYADYDPMLLANPVAPTYKRLLGDIFIDINSPSFENVGGILGTMSKGSLIQSAALVNIMADNALNVGGLIGNGFELSVLESSSQGWIRGADYVGGLAGTLGADSNNSVVSNSYSYAFVSAFNQAAPSQANSGGLVGRLVNTDVEKSFYTLGDVKSSMSSPQSSNYIYADESGGGVTCSHSFGRQPPGVPPYSSGSCASKTSQQLKELSTYAVGISNMVEVGTQNDAAKKFYVASADINQNTAAISFYDYPRLKWELEVQSEASFLARPCSGSLSPTASMLGAGTESDPYRVCQVEQLFGATSNWNDSSKHFKLMRDLDFEFSFPAGASDGLGRNGVLSAKLDGQGKSFLNVFMTPSSFSNTGSEFRLPGLWGLIGSTGEIKNLKLQNVNLNYVSNGTLGSANNQSFYAGLVAPLSEGKIQGIILEDSSLDAKAMVFSDQYAFKVFVGGLVGKNYSSGTGTGIINRINGKTFINFLTEYACLEPPCAYNNLNHWDETNIGGIVGLNAGSISEVETHLRFKYYPGDEANSLVLEDEDFISLGAIVGENASGGVVRRSAGMLSGEVNNNSTPSATDGNFYWGGIAGVNRGTILDSVGSIVFGIDVLSHADGTSTTSVMLGGIAGKQESTGNIQRNLGFINNQSNTSLDSFLGGLVGHNSSGTVTSSVCSSFGSSSVRVGSEVEPVNCLSGNYSVTASGSGTLTFADDVSGTLSVSDWAFDDDFDNLDDSTPWYFAADSGQLFPYIRPPFDDK